MSKAGQRLISAAKQMRRLQGIDYSQPCKSGQPYVAADGSCLRCGTDQGVACPLDSMDEVTDDQLQNEQKHIGNTFDGWRVVDEKAW